jgi:hypothetical protein
MNIIPLTSYSIQLTLEQQRAIKKQLADLPSEGECVIMLVSEFKLRDIFTQELYTPGLPASVKLPLNGWLKGQITAGLMTIREDGRLRK